MWTPCDEKDENGKFHCPYADTYSGYEDEMCRVCCGLGVDEDTYPEEDYDDCCGLYEEWEGDEDESTKEI